MKKLIATSLVLVAFGIVGACSQGDTHPPFLGDCDACGQPIVSTGGDAATDVSKPDTSVTDSGTQDSTTNDSSSDVSVADVAIDTGLLDTGTPD